MGNKRNLEDALKEVLNNIDSIVDDAVKEAGIKARKDYKAKAKDVVKHYYDSYKPKSYKYKRQGRLYKTINSFNKSSGHRIYVGATLDGSKLAGMYDNDEKHKRNGSSSKYHQTGSTWTPINWSSQKPGVIRNVDGSVQYEQFGGVEWAFVFSNFVEGEHPVTDGNKSEGYTYKPKKNKDGKSAEDLFVEYVNSYPYDELMPFIENRIRHKVLKQLKTIK